MEWIHLITEKEHFRSYTASVTQGFENVQGHLSDISFLTIDGYDEEGSKKQMNLVLKYSKNDETLRLKLSVKMALDAEIFIYSMFIPECEKLLAEKGIAWTLDFHANCCRCIKLENMEVLALENLKTEGYETHNKMTPFNKAHCKAVLKEYAKLHALSFAIRDQKKELFEELKTRSQNVIVELIKSDEVRSGINKSMAQALSVLCSRGDTMLCDVFRDIVGEDGAGKFLEIMEQEEKQAVFIHGDCWNDNFLFKYEANSKEAPSDVKIIDWQQSTLASPALDLAFFLYDVGSKEVYDNFDELLMYYYSCFDTFLKTLGSDPSKLFTLENLRQHWRKYSLAAVIDFLTLIKYVLSAGGSTDEGFGNAKVSDEELYYSRVKDVISHFVQQIKY